MKSREEGSINLSHSCKRQEDDNSLKKISGKKLNDSGEYRRKIESISTRASVESSFTSLVFKEYLSNFKNSVNSLFEKFKPSKVQNQKCSCFSVQKSKAPKYTFDLRPFIRSFKILKVSDNKSLDDKDDEIQDKQAQNMIKLDEDLTNRNLSKREACLGNKLRISQISLIKSNSNSESHATKYKLQELNMNKDSKELNCKKYSLPHENLSNSNIDVKLRELDLKMKKIFPIGKGAILHN